MLCSRKMILRSSTGPAHRNPSEDVEMDEDDQRDYEDYNYQTQEDDEDSDSDDFRLQRLVQILVDSMEFTAPDAPCQRAWLWNVLEGSHRGTHVQVVY